MSEQEFTITRESAAWRGCETIDEPDSYVAELQRGREIAH